MNAKSDDPRITAYVFDELHGAELKAFEAELRDSAELRLLLDQTRETVGQITDRLADEPELHLTDSQRAIIDDAAGQVQRREPQNGGADPLRRWSLNVGVLAALLLIGMFLAFPLANRRMSQDVASSVEYLGGNQGPEQAQDYVMAEPATSGGDASLPFPEEPPLVYPDAEFWQYITAERTKWAKQQDERQHLSDGNDVAKHADELGTSDPELSRFTIELEREALNELSGAERLAQQARLIELKRQFGIASETNDVGVRYADKPRAKNAWPVAEPATVTARPEVEPQAIHRFIPSVDDHPLVPRDEGRGPGQSGDKHDLLTDNSFQETARKPLSTFSIDVDTASYSKVRMYLTQHNRLPRRDAVRVEELVNYFSYDYPGPTDDAPFAAHVEVAECPWKPEHRLARIGLKGYELEEKERPASNLVFLLDVSGSMRPANKLPLLKHGMSLLIDQLREKDRVAIAVYAGAAGLVLDSTPGNEQATIHEALGRLNAGGSTNGGAGIRLAYQTALDNFIPGGVNRVILCTDGDFNVGTTGTDELVQLAEENGKSNVFLSVLGFGMGNHDDAMLEQITNKGNGNYFFIDTEAEAEKVMVKEMQGTLVTIAKDVKIQIEFNPREVAKYRLIGYANRMLAAQDFNDDKKDAGEIGAGHTVTALYEIVPTGIASDVEVPPIDDLKYQAKANPSEAAGSGELLTVKLRYKPPEGNTSTLLQFPVADEGKSFNETSKDYRFAAAVASFGMLLRESEYKGNTTYDAVQEIAQESVGSDEFGYRSEFLGLVQKAKELVGQ